MTDMPEQEQPTGAKKKNNTLVIVIVVAAALTLLLCCCITVILAFSASGSNLGIQTPSWLRRQAWEDVTITGPRVKAQRTAEKEFTVVEDSITLTVDNQVGDIDVIGGESDRVYVTAYISTWASNRDEADGYLDRVQVEILQTGSSEFSLVGTFPTPWPFGQSPTIDWTVRVPRSTTVDITSDVGDVTLKDTSGKVVIDNAVGDVRLRDVTAALDVRSDVGDVTVENWEITGDSRVTSSVGSIEVEMAPDSSFVLSADSDVGSITSDYLTDAERDKDLSPGDRLEGSVGSEPVYELFLSTNTGSISIVEVR